MKLKTNFQWRKHKEPVIARRKRALKEEKVTHKDKKKQKKWKSVDDANSEWTNLVFLQYIVDRLIKDR